MHPFQLGRSPYPTDARAQPGPQATRAASRKRSTRAASRELDCAKQKELQLHMNLMMQLHAASLVKRALLMLAVAMHTSYNIATQTAIANRVQLYPRHLQGARIMRWVS